jgi:glycosyltransferase involved in cell wall biosynthesis
MDILHAHMGADNSFYRKKIFIDTAAFWGKSIIIHQHGGDFQTFYYVKSNEKTQAMIRRTLNKAVAFLVLAPPWVDFFAPLIPRERITVLANAVRIPLKGKQDFSNCNLLLLSRLCEEKGVGDVLAVWPRIIEKFPDACLYLGGVWDSRMLREQAEALGTSVKYLGWIGEAEKEKYRERCSIFVMPTHFDGISLSVLEAMAAGMAVLTTHVGGIPEVITDGVEGRLIAPKDREALDDVLTELLKSEELRRKLGCAARRQAESRDSISDSVEQLCRIYASVLKGGGLK